MTRKAQGWLLTFILSVLIGFGVLVNCSDETPGEKPRPEDPSDPGDPKDPKDPKDPEDPKDPTDPTDPTDPVDFPPIKADLKIALTGDTDTTTGGEAVFAAIKKWGADAVIVAGDLNYSGSNAKAWEDQVDKYLGSDFPIFVARGNHDKPWTTAGHYRERLTARWTKQQDKGVLTFKGDPGMLSETRFQGLLIIAVAPSNGVPHDEAADYIRSFKDAPEIWRIATWHENMPPFRGNAGCGSGGDIAGWEVYEASREIGAIILNGHNHVYGRSKLLSCMGGSCSTKDSGQCGSNSQLPTVADVPDPVNSFEIREGESFVVLSGMGGHANGSIKQSGDWWAAQSGKACTGESCKPSSFGSLLCTFNPGGKDQRKAECSFVDVEGKITDTFTVRSEVGLK